MRISRRGAVSASGLARVRLSCPGDEVSGPCRGTVTLSRGGRRLGALGLPHRLRQAGAGGRAGFPDPPADALDGALAGSEAPTGSGTRRSPPSPSGSSSAAGLSAPGAREPAAPRGRRCRRRRSAQKVLWVGPWKSADAVGARPSSSQSSRQMPGLLGVCGRVEGLEAVGARAPRTRSRPVRVLDVPVGMGDHGDAAGVVDELDRLLGVGHRRARTPSRPAPGTPRRTGRGRGRRPRPWRCGGGR